MCWCQQQETLLEQKVVRKENRTSEGRKTATPISDMIDCGARAKKRFYSTKVENAQAVKFDSFDYSARTRTTKTPQNDHDER